MQNADNDLVNWWDLNSFYGIEEGRQLALFAEFVSRDS